MARASTIPPMLLHSQLSQDASEIVRLDCLVCFSRAMSKPADMMTLIVVSTGDTHNAIIPDGPDRDLTVDYEFGDLMLKAMDSR